MQPNSIKPAVEFPAWPQWDEHERNNILKALQDRNWGTLGPVAMGFARRFAEYIGVPHAVPVNSGSQAMQILLEGAGIGFGDEVIVPAYACSPTASAVAITGAVPVFADVGAGDACLLPSEVERLITSKTRAIIAVHLGGMPCDMEALNRVAKRHSILLLEDCSHAHGAEFLERRAGSLGNGAIFSFGSGMNMTCGEGGIIVTGSYELYAECWHLHTSGRALAGSSEFGGTVLMGTNGRMAEWEAAILDAQMDRLEAQNATRTRNAVALKQKLGELDGLILRDSDPRVSLNAFNYFGVRLDLRRINCDRNGFVYALAARGTPATTGFAALCRMEMLKSESYVKSTGHAFADDKRTPNAEVWAESSVWLPGRVLLGTEEHVAKIFEDFREVALANAT